MNWEAPIHEMSGMYTTLPYNLYSFILFSLAQFVTFSFATMAFNRVALAAALLGTFLSFFTFPQISTAHQANLSL